jgi:hypothetical protein
MNHRLLARIAGTVALLLALALAIEGFQCFRMYHQMDRLAHQQGQAATLANARKIDEELARFEALSHELRQKLESGSLKPEDLPSRLTGILARAPEACMRLGVLFPKTEEASQGRWSGPYAARDAKSLHVYNYDTMGDAGSRALFQRELAQAGWSEPHSTHEGPLLVVDYSEPFHLPNAAGMPGIVRLEIGLEGVRHILATADLGRSGYGFLLSAKGVFLADPRNELVRKGRTILEVADEMKDPGRRTVGQLALRGEGGSAESVSGLTGQKTWLFLEPVPRAHWSLGIAFLKDEMAAPPLSMRTLVIRLTTLSVGLILALLYLAFNAWNPSLTRQWYFSVAGSVVIVLGTATLWYFAYTLPQNLRGRDIPVTDPGSLQTFLNKYGHLEAGLGEMNAELIPTGVYVETLEFNGSGQVQVTGKVWQRFPKDGNPEARAGVTFPEAVSGKVEPPVEREVAGERVLLSSFQVVLRQKLANSPNYPFDHATIRLWVRPKALWRDEILVPDLGSYLLLIPRNLPGVDRELNVSGWKVERSFFSYLVESYNANFGMQDYVGQQVSPELLFNVTLKREFLNPFIATFLPILAVLGVLFAAVMTITRDPHKLQTTTYQCLNFIRNAASLFFPIILAQINLRSKLDTDRVIYLEHYYFVVYAVILLVATDALLVALSTHELVTYEDNALPKLGFWPLVLTAFYLVSIQFLL